MITYTPRKNPQRAYIIMFAFMALSVLFFISSGFVAQYKWLYQIFGVICAVVFIQVMLRYVIYTFTYKCDGKDFVITKNQGNRSAVVCDIDLQWGVELLSEKEFKEKSSEYKNIKARYSYCQNIAPQNAYFYIFEYQNSLSLVSFEPNDALVDMLSKSLKKDFN